MNNLSHLGEFSNTQKTGLYWGEFGVRIATYFIQDFMTTYRCVDEGIIGLNFYDVGDCIGYSLKVILDNTL